MAQVARPLIPTTDPVWGRLRRCESGGRYDINTGNGFYGAYQFVPSTWRGLGFPGMPHQAPPDMQDEAAQKLQARSGWGQWPACTRKLGLR
jgi:resuscitation-promoting factor RpfA